MNRKLLTSLQLSTLIATAAAATTGLAQETETKIGAFVDFQTYSQYNQSADSEYGFKLNDGALYLSHALGAHSLTLDLPFEGRDNGADADAGGAPVTLPTSKIQAFITASVGSDTKMTFGQFDTPFGFEMNDSKDNFFNSTGVISNNLLPTTHAGLMSDTQFGNIGVKLLLANEYGNGLNTGGNPSPGFVISYASEDAPISGSLGAIANNVGTGAEYLINALVNVDVGSSRTLDFEGDVEIKENQLNDLNVWAVMAQYTQTINDTWSAGLNAEYIAQFTNGYSYFVARAGVNKSITDTLKLKADVALIPGGELAEEDTTTSLKVAVAAVYSF